MLRWLRVASVTRGGSGAAGDHGAGAGSRRQRWLGPGRLPTEHRATHRSTPYCDEVQLALMTNGGATVLRVSGKVESGLGQCACMLVGSVDLVRADETVAQSVDDSGASLSSGDTALWASAMAAAEVASVCDDEAGRVECDAVTARAGPRRSAATPRRRAR